MCGRYSFSKSKSNDIIERFGPVQLEFEFGPRYNIAPSQQVPVVIHKDGGNRLLGLWWGLIPFWAKDEHLGNKLINARAETLEERPSFRKSFEQKRCLVLADGFYEWRKEGRVKKPFRIALKEGELFAFAGLWDSWLSPTGQTINTCTIITTTPNELMEPIHNRMPVILLDYKTISLYSGLEEQDIENFMKNTNSIGYEKKYKLATASMILHYLFKNPN